MVMVIMTTKMMTMMMSKMTMMLIMDHEESLVLLSLRVSEAQLPFRETVGEVPCWSESLVVITVVAIIMIKKVGWWFRFVMKLLFIIDSRQGPHLTLWVGWGTWTYINSSDLRSGAGGVACSPWRWRSKRKDPATSDNLTSSPHDGPVSQPWLNRLIILSWNKKLLLAKL